MKLFKYQSRCQLFSGPHKQQHLMLNPKSNAYIVCSRQPKHMICTYIPHLSTPYLLVLTNFPRFYWSVFSSSFCNSVVFLQLENLSQFGCYWIRNNYASNINPSLVHYISSVSLNPRIVKVYPNFDLARLLLHPYFDRHCYYICWLKLWQCNGSLLTNC